MPEAIVSPVSVVECGTGLDNKNTDVIKIFYLGHI